MNDVSTSLCSFTCFVFLHPGVSPIPASGSAKTWPFHPSPLVPESCFILCVLPCVLMTEALRSRNSVSYWMPGILVFRALGQLIFQDAVYHISCLPSLTAVTLPMCCSCSWVWLRIVCYQKAGKGVSFGCSYNSIFMFLLEGKRMEPLLEIDL